MAEIKVLSDDFSLTSTWTCRTVYSYNSTGSFSSASNSITGPYYAEKTVQFPVSVPAGVKVTGAKVHALHTTGSYGGKFEINGMVPDDNGFVTLDSPDFSAGYVEVTFRWTSYTDGSSAHTSAYPTYNGSSSQTKTTNHSSESNVTDVYLLIETESGGCIIYRAEDGVLVPYQLYHAEDGVLVPYKLQHAVDGALVSYG